MTTLSTDGGQVQVMKQAKAGEAADNVGSNDRAGLYETFV